MMMMMNIVKSCVSGFSHAKLEAGRNELESSPKVVAVCFQGLARLSRRVRRRFVRRSREISPCHPYIELILTLCVG